MNKKIEFNPFIVFFVFIISSFLVPIPIMFYNDLQEFKIDIEANISKIDIQIQRRYDLIPNLVETVKGSSVHEEKVIADIANARAKMGSASNPVQKDEANTELNGALSRLIMLSEKYPDLKANAQFNKLMNDLSDIEEKILLEKYNYIKAVSIYNKAVTCFPRNIIANCFGFVKMEQLKIDENKKTNPDINF